uniref:Protein-serine/threonine phosphatase n=1 Tax=viral metagenome TaxID=1070528 RepID=A0A6C0JHR0_9ZZZZ
MDFTYKTYCMGRMLLDKGIGYMYSKDTRDLGKTKRIYDVQKSMFNSLYDLTYQSTYIIGNIYLGNAYNARDYYSLSNNNIGLIINCTEEIPNYFKDHFDYHRIDVKDVNGANIYPYIDECVELIHDYIDNNPLKDVFVHCFMGSSRSATIVAAYLMKYYKFNLRDAVSFIKEKRNIININTDFYNQLKQYQKYLRNGEI